MKMVDNKWGILDDGRCWGKHTVTLLSLKRKCCQFDAIYSMIIIPAMTIRVHVACPSWKSHSNVFSCHISVPPNRQANIVTESYPRSPLKITLPKEARDNSGRTYFIPLRPRNKVRARVKDRHLYKITVYCHNMMTSSSGNIFRITGHVCGQFTGLFFDWRLNQRLSKQSWGWRFETLSRP